MKILVHGVMFSTTAIDLRSLAQEPVGLGSEAALVVLDGTWAQTKTLFVQNPRLQQLKQVCVRKTGESSLFPIG